MLACESNGKGRKREFSLAEESPRKPEGFRESERSERVRFRTPTYKD
jgi:hypothetical protein